MTTSISHKAARTTAAAILSLGLAAPALAMPAISASTFAFDFTFERAAAQTEQGAEAIYADLKAEVAAHCEVDGFPTRILNVASMKRCMADTLETAVAEIGTDAIKAVHARDDG